MKYKSKLLTLMNTHLDYNLQLHILAQSIKSKVKAVNFEIYFYFKTLSQSERVICFK